MATRGLEEKSFCHVSEFIDCDTAMASRYSRIKTPYGTILTSELGILYYLLVALGLLYAQVSPNGRATLAFLFVSSLFAIVESVAMAYLSVFRLDVLCLLCFTTYFCNLLLALLFPVALGIRYSEVPKFIGGYIRSFFGKGEMKARPLFHLGMTLLILVVGIVFFRGLNPGVHKAHAEISSVDYVRIFNAIPSKPIDTAGRPYWGEGDGRVTLVEFSDFQCPFCRLAAFTLKPYLKEFQKNIRFVFMNYPLDNSCNPAIPHPMHPVSCMAAKAGICANQMGKFWEYHDKVFENQKKLSRDTLLKLAPEVGLNQEAFEKCLVSDETAALLKKDIDEGAKLDIRGTPSVYLNGRPLREWPNPDRLRTLLEAEISATSRQ